MALSTSDTNWVKGFISFFKKAPRPVSAGSQRDGWDAAASTIQKTGWGH